ncbi:hypothetical protein Syun_020554 [Stephania yunnanensis]|uniref:Response regulatory domain-containing protein n=1 Tax=Stephania yunnanensis TaxID=152371 RepID=A0AAP0IEF8_9MAGN
MGSSAEMKGKNVTIDEEKEMNFKNKLTALVVDDSKMHRLIHKKLLATLGVESQEAENGKEAVDICLSGEAFNLILMDYDMPVMDGREATKLLRENGVDTMILGVTARSREWEREEFMGAGLNDCQEKPLTRAKLLSALQEVDAKL